MAYTSKAALEAAYGVEDVAALSTIDGVQTDTAIDAAIEEADRLIDSYAHKRHAVPFATTPPAIAALARRMAVRNLRRDRRMTLAQDVTDDEADRKWLELLAKGLVTVGVDPAPPADTATIDKAGTRDATTKAVSRERLKGFW